MRKQWLITACATALLAFSNVAALAQDPIDPIHGQTKRVHHLSLSKQQYRQVSTTPRQYARTYFHQDELGPTFKQPDPWNNNHAGSLEPGFALDRDTRKASRTTPDDNEGTRSFGRSSRGYPYVVTGGHVIQFDSSKRVQDAAHVEINIGR